MMKILNSQYEYVVELKKGEITLKKTIVLVIVLSSVLSSSITLAAGSLFQDTEKELRSKVTMEYGQMESRVNAYIVSQTENFKGQEKERIEKEVKTYLEEKMEEVGLVMGKKAEKVIKEENDKISKEADQVIEQLKTYIDNTIIEWEL